MKGITMTDKKLPLTTEQIAHYRSVCLKLSNDIAVGEEAVERAKLYEEFMFADYPEIDTPLRPASWTVNEAAVSDPQQ